MSAPLKARPLLSAGIGLILLIAAGCGSDPPEPARVPSEPARVTTAAIEGADASMSGTVTYRERIALTPGATLTVQIRDTSYADAASELIAEQIISDPGQVPIRFEVAYGREDVDQRNTYSVSARIEESDGRLAFINDTAYDVITRGNPSRVDMVLVLVEPPPEMVEGEWSAEDRALVEEPVTVTDAHLIWEGGQAFVRVAFIVADIDGCYSLGREEATVDGSDIIVDVTAWVPPPAPWAIDCSDESLELDAVMHLGDSLVTGQTYDVIVNGEAAFSFAVP